MPDYQFTNSINYLAAAPASSPTGVSKITELVGHAMDPPQAAGPSLDVLAACSRYHIIVDLPVNLSTETRLVDVYLLGAGSDVELPIETRTIAQRPGNTAVFNAVLYRFEGDVSTPQDYNAWYIGVRAHGSGLIHFRPNPTAPAVTTVNYLGSSVQCGDDGFPTPPWDDIWCEPFLAVDDDAVDQLIGLHFERIGELADHVFPPPP